MKRLTVVVVALGLMGSAQAADMLFKAPPSTYARYDWSGIYVGANAGYGWADTSWNFGAPFTDEVTHPKGALAGGQIGINKQWGSWISGIELAGDWSGLSDSIPVGIATMTTKLHDLETLTGRLGYAFNNVLVYGKAGGATGRLSVDGVNAAGDTFSTGKRLSGTTAGAGIEYGLTPSVVLGVEYDFTRLFAGHFDPVSAHGLSVPFDGKTPFDVQAVTGRVSYKFN